MIDTQLVTGSNRPSDLRTHGLRRGTVLSLVVASLLASACYDQILTPADESNDRLAITNDEGSLDARVSYPDSDVPIGGPAPSSGGAAAVGPALAPSSVSLTLRAEATPPTISGTTAQATSVSATTNSKAVVSYNLRGAQRLGGADVFINLTSRPKLQSSVAFADSDVNAISIDDQLGQLSYVYAAVATDDPGFAFPAVLERIQLNGNNFTLDGNLRVPLTSFAATSTVSTESEVYATSGDNGDVFAFSASDLSLLGQYALDDARWVAWDEANSRVVVAQVTPGRISVFAEGEFPGGSMTLLNTFPFPGADVPESKSAIDIAGGKAFIAAGPTGVQIICLDDGQVVGACTQRLEQRTSRPLPARRNNKSPCWASYSSTIWNRPITWSTATVCCSWQPAWGGSRSSR
jgi:hypothetical protein